MCILCNVIKIVHLFIARVCTCMCHCTRIGIRGQSLGVVLSFHCVGSLESNSGCQAWQQMSLPINLSCWLQNINIPHLLWYVQNVILLRHSQYEITNENLCSLKIYNLCCSVGVVILD